MPIVRLKSRLTGEVRRIDVSAFDTFTLQHLYDAAATEFGSVESVSNQQSGQRPFAATADKTLAHYGLRHGDMLFVTHAAANTPTTTTTVTTTGVDLKKVSKWVHPVDLAHFKSDGLMQRPRAGRLCRHGPNGMCDYCMPLEPYDPTWLAENKLKHMSYHAFLRQQLQSVATAHAALGGSKSWTPWSLLQSAKHIQHLQVHEQPWFRVKPNCDAGHPRYPLAMCAKCQPSAVMLQQQPFRMVDHVEFEQPGFFNEFLGFWRASGLQRFGYLLGRYEPYAVEMTSTASGEQVVHGVPLGVKAVVAAIYEPKQLNGVDGIELVQDDDAQQELKHVQELCDLLGLMRVGMVYTDLTDDGTGKGKVVCKRHADSFFVSSAEAVFMAHQQNQHPNLTPFAPKLDDAETGPMGTFGSKFVSVIVSGDQKKDVHLATYQVSNNCMGMVRDDIINPTMDPTQVRVIESTKEKYVPEVFYRYRNKYGVNVQEAAKPCFPVEYLLVSLTEGFPQVPTSTFTSKSMFVIENRGGLGEAQSMAALKKHLDTPDLVHALNDFHALLFLKKSGVFDAEAFKELVRILHGVQESEATSQRVDYDAVKKQILDLAAFQTLQLLLQDVSISSTLGGAGASAAGGSMGSGGAAPKPDWACRHCTFQNVGSRADCEMCGLPRD